MPEVGRIFAYTLELLLQPGSASDHAIPTIQSLAGYTDRDFPKVWKRLNSLIHLDGENTVQLLLFGSIWEMGYPIGSHILSKHLSEVDVDPRTQELYLSLANVLATRLQVLVLILS